MLGGVAVAYSKSGGKFKLSNIGKGKGGEREIEKLHSRIKGTERAHVLSLAVAVRLWKEFRGDDTIAHAELPALRRMLNDSRNLSIVCQVRTYITYIFRFIFLVILKNLNFLKIKCFTS